MGGNQSTLAGIEGFQIVRVMPSSPAHVAGLIPFFDFILSVDNIQLSIDNNRVFKEYVVRNKNNVITLSVFNTKIRMVREVSLTPSDTWGGIGLLGCSINWEVVEKTLEYTWHIVDVIQGSAAQASGIVAQRDYIVGMQCREGEDRGLITMLSHPGDFHARLEQWAAERAFPARAPTDGLLLLIYDNSDNSLREVMVQVPHGAPLGIDVASGLLHAVPHNTGDMRLPFMKAFFVPQAQEQVVPSQVPYAQAGMPSAQPQPVYAPPPPPQFQQPYVPVTYNPTPQPTTPPVQNSSPTIGQLPHHIPAQHMPGGHPAFPAPPTGVNAFPVPPPPHHTEPHPYVAPQAVPPPQWGAPYQPPFVFPTLPPMPQPLTPT